MTESTTKIPLHSKSQIYSFPAHTTLWNPTTRAYFTGIFTQSCHKDSALPQNTTLYSILLYSTTHILL